MLRFKSLLRPRLIVRVKKRRSSPARRWTPSGTPVKSPLVK
jgi:hypothetical protein